MSIEALQVMFLLNRVVLQRSEAVRVLRGSEGVRVLHKSEGVLHRSKRLKATLSTNIIIAHHISAPKVANVRCNFTAA